MNKEIKISIVDLCVGYGCMALLMYMIGGVAYACGKTKARVEVTQKLDELLKPKQPT